jgi:hypothetical protein
VQTESPGRKASTRTATRARRVEDLPYVIELWQSDNPQMVEHVLARAWSAQLATAIFKAVKEEHPDRRITLRKGNHIVQDTIASDELQT